MKAAGRKKILIVEDNQDLVSGLCTFLKGHGYEPLVAYDALYGIKLAYKEDVHLLILDLGLPGGGGIYVIENLKKSEKTAKIPIVVLTGKKEKELQEQAEKLGVNAYLLKPFVPETLLLKINEIIG